MSNDNNVELQKLIGKPIEDALKLGELTKTRDNLHALKLNPDKVFFNQIHCSLQISTENDETIKSVSVNFPVILDRFFYNEMIEIYGFPNGIFKRDKLLSESKSVNLGEEGFKQNLTKREYSMKEVAFEDKPFFIIWEKGNVQIKTTFYYEQNGTQLTFRKPTDKL